MKEDNNRFTLRWDDFEKNIIGAFKDLRNDEDFYDCTIVCSTAKIRAHRVILSACSPTFRDMIRCTSHHHPVIFLRGMRQIDIEGLLDFMYHGEVLIEEQELETFLKTAEDLQVRGLCQMGSSAGGSSSVDSAVEEDVQRLLRTADEPASKRIKPDPDRSERVRGGLLSSFGPGLSVSVKQEKVAAPPPSPLQSSVNASPTGSTGSDSTHDVLKSLLSRDKIPGDATTPVKYFPQISPTSGVTAVKQTAPPASLALSSSASPQFARTNPVSISQSLGKMSGEVRFNISVQSQSANNPPASIQMSQLRGVRPSLFSPNTGANLFSAQSFPSPDLSRAQIMNSGTASPPVLHLPETFLQLKAPRLHNPVSSSTAPLNIQTAGAAVSAGSLNLSAQAVMRPDQQQGLVPTVLTAGTLNTVLADHLKALLRQQTHRQAGPHTVILQQALPPQPGNPQAWGMQQQHQVQGLQQQHNVQGQQHQVQGLQQQNNVQGQQHHAQGQQHQVQGQQHPVQGLQQQHQVQGLQQQHQVQGQGLQGYGLQHQLQGLQEQRLGSGLNMSQGLQSLHGQPGLPQVPQGLQHHVLGQPQGLQHHVLGQAPSAGVDTQGQQSGGSSGGAGAT